MFCIHHTSTWSTPVTTISNFLIICRLVQQTFEFSIIIKQIITILSAISMPAFNSWTRAPFPTKHLDFKSPQRSFVVSVLRIVAQEMVQACWKSNFESNYSLSAKQFCGSFIGHSIVSSMKNSLRFPFIALRKFLANSL